MTANDRFVYVVRGDMLYQFDANTLEPRAQRQMPAPQQRDRALRPGGGAPGRAGDGAPAPPRP